jgi:membrane dipeptidase
MVMERCGPRQPAWRIAAAVLLSAFFTSCASTPRDARLGRILADAIVVDTHIDAPFRIERTGVDLSVRNDSGQFDLVRAQEGRLGVAFMSIFVPSSEDEAGRGLALAERQISHVEALVARAPDRAALVRCVEEARHHADGGRVALALGLENGGPLAMEADALDRLVARGIRYVTLAHSRSNAFSDSSYDPRPRWSGLSAEGVDLVRRLNAHGVMVDVSHLSDQAAWQVLKVSSAPVIASHSNARRFTPGFERNLPDDLIRAIAAAGGVIQVNFGATFVTAEARAWQARRDESFRRFRDETGAAFASSEARAFLEAYGARHPIPEVTLAHVLDHVDHIVALVGARHVGIGSDFDGAGDTLPRGLEDVTAYPNFAQGLLARGYREREIRAVLGENLLRVWSEVEALSVVGRAGACSRPIVQ